MYRCGANGHGLVVGLGRWLDLVTLKVFSYLDDSEMENSNPCTGSQPSKVIFTLLQLPISTNY